MLAGLGHQIYSAFIFSVVNEECYTYTSGTTGQVERCRVSKKANLMSMQCQLVNLARRGGNSGKPARKGLFRTPPAYRIAPVEEDIMNEIRQRGPVQGWRHFSYIQPSYDFLEELNRWVSECFMNMILE